MQATDSTVSAVGAAAIERGLNHLKRGLALNSVRSHEELAAETVEEYRRLWHADARPAENAPVVRA